MRERRPFTQLAIDRRRSIVAAAAAGLSLRVGGVATFAQTATASADPSAVPAGAVPMLYTVARGDTYAGIAASHGISLARLYALNPELTPLGQTTAEKVVVGLR